MAFLSGLSTRRLIVAHPAHLSIKPTIFQRSLCVTQSLAMDYGAIPTPASCYADFCLVPVGTGNTSVAAEVAEVQKVIKASGLKHTMHSAGTTVEGAWDEVMAVIGKAHTVVHKTGAVRVQTSMRVGTRTDKSQTAEDKVKRVQDLLKE